MLQATSGTTLALTGILGLAAVVYVLYYLRGGPGRKPGEPGSQQQQRQVGQDPSKPSTSSAAGGVAAPAAQPAVAPSAAVSRRLAGVKLVTMSVSGVLLEESSPEEFEESACVRADAIAVARDVARCCPRGLYLMCQVCSDIGEAVVRGALEHAGLIGTAPGQVLPHRLLFCETLVGKNSFVRQLEPDVHIDAHPSTVSDLQRFVRQLVLVAPPGQPQIMAAAGSSSSGGAAANVQQAPSLVAAFGVAPA